MKKLFVLWSFVLLIIVAYSVSYFSRPLIPKHVFINKTSDHRFDESIQVSIYSAFSRTGVQNAVVILTPSKKTSDLNLLTAQIFKKLNLGRETHGQAILYLFIPEQKLLKIEIGYALESVLPDMLVKGLEQAAKSFTYSGKYQDFWAELINTLNIKISEFKNSVPQNYHIEDWNYVSGGAGIINPNYQVSLADLEPQMKGLAVNDRSFSPQKELSESLSQYLESLSMGIGDANLNLLSEGSKIFRMETPMTIAQLKRNANMYSEALPFQFIQSKNLAMAYFKSGHPVLPIIFVKNAGGSWLIDEPKSWAYFHRFENSMDIFQKFKGHPFVGKVPNLMSGTKDYYVYPGAASAQNFLSTDEDFWPTFRKLESQLKQNPTAQDYFDLGDFYYFELYDLERAKINYDKGLTRAPNRFDYLWRLQDIEVNLGLNSERLIHLQKIADHFPADLELQKSNKFYQKALRFSESEWLTGSVAIDDLL